MNTNRFHLAASAASANVTWYRVDWGFLIRKTFRTLQINFPFLQDLRFSIQRWMRRMAGTVVEPDFDALPLIAGLNNGLAVDIGANRGDTIQAIKMRTKGMQVMGFEPNPLVFSRLLKLYKGKTDVKLFNFGLSDKDDIFNLNVPFYKNFMFDGLASFDAGSALGWLKGRIFFYDDKHLSLRKIECCLTRLDRFEVNPSFIKIDVQGFEQQVLEGAVETINRARPVILIETPSTGAIKLMTELKYSPYRYAQGKLQPGYGDLNTFYLADEKLDTLLSSAS